LIHLEIRRSMALTWSAAGNNQETAKADAADVMKIFETAATSLRATLGTLHERAQASDQALQSLSRQHK
jgi:hypothetical protein